VGIWRTWIDGIVETTKGAIRRPFFFELTELILKLLRMITIVKTSKNLLVLTGAEFFHQTDDDGVKSYIHKAGEKMASPELTDEKLLNLTAEEAENLSPEQRSRRELLRRMTVPLQSLPAAPVVVASPNATPGKQ
jgi:hypothetical protein